MKNIFATKNRSTNPFVSAQTKKYISPFEIKSFKGVNKTANILDAPIGQLIFNQNFEYLYSGNNVYLQTKRGSSLLVDITYKCYGAGLYIYNLVSNFILYVDSLGKLNYYSFSTDTISFLTNLTLNKQTTFETYGESTNATIFGANSSDGVFKVSGSTPTYQAIASSPNLDYLVFGQTSGRLFGVSGHTVRWTQVQSAAGTSALEDWTTTPNNAIVSPDDGTGFNCIVDFNEVVFLFKDTGIWGLINSTEDPDDWFFPKATTMGTNSPLTVKQVQYRQQNGIIFLGANKKLYFFAGAITRNAGKLPSLYDKDLYIISRLFQSVLDDIPEDKLGLCSATFHDNQYILSFYKSSTSTEVDHTLGIDCTKFMPMSGEDKIPQPYFYESNTMNYNQYVNDVNNNTVYGVNVDGFISQLFVKNRYYDEVPTRIDASGETSIENKVYTSWIRKTDKELCMEGFYFSWNPEGYYEVTVKTNSSILGDAISNYDLGSSQQIKPITTDGVYWGRFIWGRFKWTASSTISSQFVRAYRRGHYFNFGFENTTKGYGFQLYGINPLFSYARTDNVGMRR